mmetsp:Transcript_48532/g.79865  ORF Transcript_48532/g.79865 Transcript_48532/m.79865 type:complete len:94 (+) Transcript_48532:1005-1286(+)
MKSPLSRVRDGLRGLEWSVLSAADQVAPDRLNSRPERGEGETTSFLSEGDEGERRVGDQLSRPCPSLHNLEITSPRKKRLRLMCRPSSDASCL